MSVVLFLFLAFGLLFLLMFGGIVLLPLAASFGLLWALGAFFVHYKYK
jgi:hypothetical protein